MGRWAGWSSTGWRRVTVAVAAAVAVVVWPGPLPTSVAHACSCFDPAGIVPELQDKADAAFLGTVVEIRRPEVMLSSEAESRFIFDVETVFKGDTVRARQSIVTASDGAACGLELSVGATAVVFARKQSDQVTPDDGEFASNLCEVIARPSPAVLSSLGEGRPPVAGSSPIGADGSLASTLIRHWPWIVASLVAAAIAVVLTIRHRRHRAPARVNIR
ncbi:MAG TPA: hypothetical protein PLV68_08190 [Ilumatobacteraceae bacterium]|nr:hypothetical protein [Ilumatobacteraceae bacterium]